MFLRRGILPAMGIALAMSFIDSEAAIIPYNPTTAELFQKKEPTEKEKIEQSKERLEFLEKLIEAPYLWGQNLLGADFISADWPSLAAELDLKPVHVIVSDGGKILDASSQIKISEPERPPKVLETELKLPDWFLPPLTPGSSTQPSPIFGKRTLIPRLTDRYIKIKIPNPVWARIPPYSPDHASHVAGIIGAGKNLPFNISPAVEIEDMDIFMGVGASDSTTVLEGIHFLLNRSEESPVLNMSVSLTNDPQVFSALTDLVKKRDTLCSVASGNDGVEIESSHMLSHLHSCTVVGAFGLTGTTTSFSNYGDAVDIVAPGESILSRVQKGVPIYMNGRDLELDILSGTSMATPMVSGTYALLRSLLPRASNDQIRKIVAMTAIDIGLPGKDKMNGYGLLDTFKAYEIAKALRRMKMAESRESIEAVLSEPSTFLMAEPLSRLAIIEKMKAGYGTPEYEMHFRKEVLLKGKVEGFGALGRYYDRALGMKALGLAYQFMAANRSDTKLSQDEIQVLAGELAPLWLRRMPTQSSLGKTIINPSLKAALTSEMKILSQRNQPTTRASIVH